MNMEETLLKKMYKDSANAKLSYVTKSQIVCALVAATIANVATKGNEEILLENAFIPTIREYVKKMPKIK